MQSVVLIIPAHLREQANSLGSSLGYGPDNFSVPLYSEGATEPTHYGLHAWGSKDFIELIDDDGMPVGLEHFAEVKQAVTSSVAGTMSGHWQGVLAAQSLTGSADEA